MGDSIPLLRVYDPNLMACLSYSSNIRSSIPLQLTSRARVRDCAVLILSCERTKYEREKDAFNSGPLKSTNSFLRTAV